MENGKWLARRQRAPLVGGHQCHLATTTGASTKHRLAAGELAELERAAAAPLRKGPKLPKKPIWSPSPSAGALPQLEAEHEASPPFGPRRGRTQGGGSGKGDAYEREAERRAPPDDDCPGRVGASGRASERQPAGSVERAQEASWCHLFWGQLAGFVPTRASLRRTAREGGGGIGRR